jgi:hypothetical protein
MGSLNSKDLLKTAWQIDEEYEAILERKRQNRDLLRLMDANGGLDEKEQSELVELYPVRQRKNKDADPVVDEPEE